MSRLDDIRKKLKGSNLFTDKIADQLSRLINRREKTKNLHSNMQQMYKDQLNKMREEK